MALACLSPDASRRRIGALVASGALALLSAPDGFASGAVIDGSKPVLSTYQRVETNVPVSATHSNSLVSSSFLNVATARSRTIVDLTQGKMGASTYNIANAVWPTSTAGYSFTEYFEFFTVAPGSSSGSILYTLALDGSFRVDGQRSIAGASTLFRVLDVTGIASPLEYQQFFGTNYLFPSNAAPELHCSFVFIENTRRTTGSPTPNRCPMAQTIFVSAPGSAGGRFYERTISSQFSVQPGRTYMVGLGLVVDSTALATSSVAESDFLNSSRFAITSLGGVTIASATGPLIASAVPESSTLIAMLMGLLIIAFAGRRNLAVGHRSRTAVRQPDSSPTA